MKRTAGTLLETALLFCFVACIAIAFWTTFNKQKHDMAQKTFVVTTRSSQ